MIVHQASAQSWGSGAGSHLDQWVVNDDNSNNWATLRLQFNNTHAWSMSNQGGLWWGYAANGNHSDRGVEKMRLTTVGNLGIGTSTPSNEQSWDKVLDLHGFNHAKTLVTTTTGDVKTGIFSHSDWGGNGAMGVVGTESDHDLNLMAGYTNYHVTVKTDGNVGIGTTSPSDKLTLYDGEFTLQNNNNTQNQGIAFQNSGGSYTWRMYRTDAGNGFADLRFASGLNTDFDQLQDHMIIRNNGDVGIGTTNPSTTLDVAGTAHFSGHVGIGTTTPSNEQGWGRVMDVHDPSHAKILATITTEGIKTGIFSHFNWSGSGGPMGVIGTESNHDLRLMAGYGNHHVTIKIGGNVGIGTTSPSEKLEVSGNIKSDGVILNIGTFPDYVFEKDYPLMPLKQLESYIRSNKHLPGFPSEAEVVKTGANLGQINNLLVEKVEELTLYTIDQEKQIKALSDELTSIKEQLRQLLKKQ